MNPFLKCEAVFHSGEEAGCELGYYKHQGEFSSDTTGEEVWRDAGSLPEVWEVSEHIKMVNGAWFM